MWREAQWVKVVRERTEQQEDAEDDPDGDANLSAVREAAAAAGGRHRDTARVEIAQRHAAHRDPCTSSIRSVLIIGELKSEAPTTLLVATACCCS